MQALGSDNAQAAVRVAQDQNGVRLDFDHQLVAFCDDVAHSLSEVLPYRVHIDVGIGEAEVLEEDSVEIIVVVLSCVCQQGVEILAAFVDHRRQPDNLRPRPHDNQQLQLAVILKTCHNFILLSRSRCRVCRG